MPITRSQVQKIAMILEGTTASSGSGVFGQPAGTISSPTWVTHDEETGKAKFNQIHLVPNGVGGHHIVHVEEPYPHLNDPTYKGHYYGVTPEQGYERAIEGLVDTIRRRLGPGEKFNIDEGGKGGKGGKAFYEHMGQIEDKWGDLGSSRRMLGDEERITLHGGGRRGA